MKIVSMIVAATLAAVTTAGFAQTKDPLATPGIDKRQEIQQKRIDQGVKSGQLNEKEAARLERGQERIQKMEDKAKADGKVTAKERAKIHQAQDQQSRKIHREKHDKQHAKK